jgi:hypothetical protein
MGEGPAVKPEFKLGIVNQEINSYIYFRGKN